jgi:hypothetical protein
MYSLILPKAQSAMMSLFLAHVAQAYANSCMVMQVDRAGWHARKALVIPENIRLVPQPAHSPEVQPTEHSWNEVREKHVHKRVFDDLTAVEETPWSRGSLPSGPIPPGCAPCHTSRTLRRYLRPIPSPNRDAKGLL